jgi:diaminopimelate decarboxylase
MNTICYAFFDQSRYFRQLVKAQGRLLLVMDADSVRRGYLAFQRALPKAVLYYAFKSLRHPAILRLLTAM